LSKIRIISLRINPRFQTEHTKPTLPSENTARPSRLDVSKEEGSFADILLKAAPPYLELFFPTQIDGAINTNQSLQQLIAVGH